MGDFLLYSYNQYAVVQIESVRVKRDKLRLQFEALRSQLTADLNKCERVLAPFELSFSEKIMAVAGKYIW